MGLCVQELKAEYYWFPTPGLEKAMWQGQLQWNGVAILALEPSETKADP